MQTATVLCLDAGSSSLKFAVYREGGAADDVVRIDAGELIGPLEDVAEVVDRLWARIAEPPAAVGHRIVFGGPTYEMPTVADERVLRELEGLVPIEPLHLRTELDLVYAVKAKTRDAPQVLCFDTAFHQRMPAIAKRLPLPTSVGPMVRRYGFHGLSYEYVTSVLGAQAGARTIVAHLGSGASLCALRDGVPVDTTMGFSALGGLMMATRPGDLDPGVILQLIRTGYGDDAKLAELLYRHCGLAGVSGESGDVRALLASAPSDARARAALELFGYQLLKHAGAMIAVLGGLDLLVFTGGVGEHAPSIRSALCDALGWAGVRVDEAANARNASTISPPESTVAVRVIPTDENLMIARHTFELISRDV